jgi:hypothetical protein
MRAIRSYPMVRYTDTWLVRLSLRHRRLRGARETGLPPVKKPLTVAEVVFAATARAPCYLVSRSMTSAEMSSAMASAVIAPNIGTSFLRGYDPGTSGQEAHPQHHPTSHPSMLSVTWDETLGAPALPREFAADSREVDWCRARHIA